MSEWFTSANHTIIPWVPPRVSFVHRYQVAFSIRVKGQKPAERPPREQDEPKPDSPS